MSIAENKATIRIDVSPIAINNSSSVKPPGRLTSTLKERRPGQNSD